MKIFIFNLIKRYPFFDSQLKKCSEKTIENLEILFPYFPPDAELASSYFPNEIVFFSESLLNMSTSRFQRQLINNNILGEFGANEETVFAGHLTHWVNDIQDPTLGGNLKPNTPMASVIQLLKDTH